MTTPPAKRRGLLASLQRRARERDAFASTWDWLKFALATTLATKRSTGPRLSLRLKRDARPIAVRLFTSDARVVKEVLVYREYDALLPLLAALPAKPPSQRVVVDLGSNIGCSIRAWQQLWPGCTIIAAEPDAHNHALCVANARGDSHNQPGTTCIERVCIADAPGEVTLDTSVGAWGIKMQRDNSSAQGRQRVAAITLDELLRRANLDPSREIDLLKCDIEGAEAAVFATAGTWLARTCVLAVEVHPPYSMQQLEAHLRAASAAHNTHFRILGDPKAGGNAVVFATKTPEPFAQAKGG